MSRMLLNCFLSRHTHTLLMWPTEQCRHCAYMGSTGQGALQQLQSLSLHERGQQVGAGGSRSA